MGSFNIDIRDFGAMSQAETNFVNSSKVMEDRVDDLIKRIAAVQWDGATREKFNEIQQRWNGTYAELHQALLKLGQNCGDVGRRTAELEQKLTRKWGSVA